MKKKPPTLVSLCLGVVGKHLEDLIQDLDEIAINFPADIKVVHRNRSQFCISNSFARYICAYTNIYIYIWRDILVSIHMRMYI